MDGSWKDEIRTLMEKREGPCVSMFLPTYRAGQDMQQNPIRLRNMMRRAEEKLTATGMRVPEARALLEPVGALVNNAIFWRRQSDGLAIFLAADLFRYYCLPTSFNELIVVANWFHLKPLLPRLSRDERFYILALSANELKVLQGDGEGVTELDVESLPRNLADVLQYDEAQRQVRFRAVQPAVGRSASHSGSAADFENAKENLLKYFRQIDRGLKDLLREEKAPLVLAGVDYLLPIYREANTYAYLTAEGISGNPIRMGTDQLYRQARAIVERYFQVGEELALAQYRESLGTGLASNVVEEIVPAAVHGRVGVLFAAVGCQQWGTYDPETGELQLWEAAAPSGEDLLDLAAMQTYLNGGTVYMLAREKMPDQTLLAAVYRY